MSSFQGSEREEVVRLEDDTGPVTGLTKDDVTLRIRKKGEEFEDKELDDENFSELESGLYLIVFSSSDMNTLGTFTYLIKGATFNFNWSSFQVEPQPTTIENNAETCTVSGNIVDLGGSPGTQIKIQFHIGPLPSVAGGTSLISADILTTFPDAFGNFSVNLIREKDVIVEIPQTGVKQQIHVPDQESANILDLLPPIE